MTTHFIIDVATTATSETQSKIANSATSGVPYISQGTGLAGTFGTALVAGGGTGATTLTGVLIGNGTSAVTGNAITQHDVLVGGASNAITSVAPSATTGVALVSAGAAADPIFGTVGIAGGGTNATSFTQTNGIVTYNGTSLVNYAGPQISSGGIATNTTQPAFLAIPSGAVSNVTGDGTAYTIIFNSAPTNVGTNFNTTTGVFTAPVAGFYTFQCGVGTSGIGASHTSWFFEFVFTGITYLAIEQNPSTSADSGTFTCAASISKSMAAGDTLSIVLKVSGSTKTVNLLGGALSGTFLSGFLVC